MSTYNSGDEAVERVFRIGETARWSLTASPFGGPDWRAARWERSRAFGAAARQGDHCLCQRRSGRAILLSEPFSKVRASALRQRFLPGAPARRQVRGDD